MIDVLVAAFGSALLLLGLALATIGLYGMLRHPEIFEQLHAAGLVTGPAVILILLASLASRRAEIATSALLVVAFILVTSSLSTHVIALAAWRRREASDRSESVAVDARGDPARGPARLRVLLADDGSPGSDVALQFVASLSSPERFEVRLIGVTEGDLPPPRSADRSANGNRGQPAIELAAAARRLGSRGVSVGHILRGGDPATAILDEAEAFDADLVVLGSRGLGRARSILTGSVASAVLDRAQCPVLVARRPSFDAVLLATDGSAESQMAADAVARWPIFEGVRVHVLSVATLVPHYWELGPTRAWRQAAAQSRHRKIAAAAALRSQRDGPRPAIHVRLGDDAAAHIVAFAEAGSIDLIVLGSRGRTGLTRTLMGSVTRDVLESTEASVLVVRSMR